MAQLQAERTAEVTSPLGDDVLLLRRLEATEEMGRLFEYELELLSEDHAILLDDVVGQPVTIRVNVLGDEPRYLNGYVSRFGHIGAVGTYSLYRATLRPWLWFLTRTSDCRIFQDMSVPEIVKEVCSENGFSDIEDLLSETYRKWVYCVQYRETDFNFLSRLMEQEGIYYYFKHENGKHTMVLADDHSSHERCPGYEEVPFYAEQQEDPDEVEHIHEWTVEQEFQSCVYALCDYDFERPRADMKVQTKTPREHPLSEMEIFDYPGQYCEPGSKAEQFSAGDFRDSGEMYARSRVHELQSRYERATGRGNARGLFAGGLFELTDCPRGDQNREYLIVSSTLELEVSAYESGVGGDAAGKASYSCELEAIDAKQLFRPLRVTPKPVVQGPQTAIVVGPSGEEIWTDQYGRVKVQFHWDRYGEANENSSCWVRVAQIAAGKGWGGIQIPRIGHEVIVEFLEGDPDRPIITGSVYNGDAKPPFALPDGGMVGGIKSNSTPGGGGYNELSLNDTKGKEKIVMHGQYDMETTIENDQTLTVHNNRTSTVDVDDSETVGNNQTQSIGVNQDQTIGSNHTLKVGADETITIGANQAVTIGSNKTESVGSNTTESVGSNRTTTIGSMYQISVGAVMNETVGAAKAEEIGGAKTVSVGAISSEEVGANKSVSAGGSISEEAGSDFEAKAGGKLNLDAGGDFGINGKAKGLVKAASTLVLQCGGASITLKSGGDVVIKGTKITIKGSGDVTIKGSKVQAN
jgi:type VI secretion system secreted protein VgrG